MRDNINEEYYHKIERDIDKKTFYDLELDELFKKINQTYTPIGREYMYGTMFTNQAHPLLDDVSKKLDDITLLKKVIYKLHKLSKEYTPVLDMFDDDNLYSKREIKILTLSFIFPVFFFLVNLLFDVQMFDYLICWIIVHNCLYGHFVRRTYDIIDKTRSYCFMVDTLERLIKWNVYDHELNNIIKSVRKYTFLYRLNYYLSKVDVFHLLEMLNSLTFFPIFQCIIIQKNRNQLEENLLFIFEYIGLLDMAVALKKVKKQYVICTPTVSQKKELHFVECYHPLLTQPVKNTFKISKSLIITGSNTSGKSTFLKMIGINMICARVFHFCFAEEFCYYPFSLKTSIHMKDDLKRNESYYIKEIKTLKAILDKVEKQDCFIMIDEILRGTNEKERNAISVVLLEKLFAGASLIIVTTHDIYVADYFKDIEHYYFCNEIKNGRVYSDYKIKKGSWRIGNAIELLKIYEFDEELICHMNELMK